MASYTMQLKEYIEQATQLQVGLSTKDKIEAGRVKLFDFDYPIFDSDYKKIFETHFIRYFYTREIGFETEGLFKFHLETWLIINMPYFNKLFDSELITFDPLTNAKMDVTHNKTNNASNSGNSTSSQTGTEKGFQRDLNSDTPDNRLQITTNDGSGVIEYASDIGEHSQNNSNTVSGTSIGTSTANETEDFIQSRIGKIGVQTYSKMLNEYRDSFIRVENACFKEMEQLFMLVY